MNVLEDYGELVFAFPFKRIGDGGWPQHISNYFSRGCIGAKVAGAAVAGGIAQAHTLDATWIVSWYALSFNRHREFRVTKVFGSRVCAFCHYIANAFSMSDQFCGFHHLGTFTPFDLAVAVGIASLRCFH